MSYGTKFSIAFFPCILLQMNSKQHSTSRYSNPFRPRMLDKHHSPRGSVEKFLATLMIPACLATLQPRLFHRSIETTVFFDRLTIYRSLLFVLDFDRGKRLCTTEVKQKDARGYHVSLKCTFLH